MTTPPQLQIAEIPKLPKTPLNWGYIAVPVLFYSLAYVLPPILHGGDIGGGIGYLVGTMFFPVLIAFLVRGRKGDWKGFSRWFFWLGLFLPALAFNAAQSGH